MTSEFLQSSMTIVVYDDGSPKVQRCVCGGGGRGGCVCECVCQLVLLLEITARWACVCKPVGMTPRRQNERASFLVAGSLYLSA